MAEFFVNGIVSQRDKEPYLQLSNEKGMIAQLTMGQARNIAMDMLVMCSRSEMDAMIRKFFDEELEHPQMADVLMMKFRDYRAKLDQEKVERSMTDPDTGEIKG
jgi:hypothetical protein